MRLRTTVVGGVLIALLYVPSGAAARADEPTAPLLQDLERRAAPVATEATGTAHSLPGTMTICRDAASAACWSVAGKSACRSKTHQRASVYRVLPVSESRRLADALHACSNKK